jgi:hypothetical protein
MMKLRLYKNVLEDIAYDGNYSLYRWSVFLPLQIPFCRDAYAFVAIDQSKIRLVNLVCSTKLRTNIHLDGYIIPHLSEQNFLKKYQCVIPAFQCGVFVGAMISEIETYALCSYQSICLKSQFRRFFSRIINSSHSQVFIFVIKNVFI